MQEPQESSIVDLLTRSGGRSAIGAVLEAVGATLHDSSVRSVHRRGSSSVAIVHEVSMTDGAGVRRERLYVTHTSTRDVPKGAAQVDLDGTIVHVWQFPDDPYMPALRPAVSRTEAGALLARLGLVDGPSPDLAIRTRSYRPTRRAVVQLRPGPDADPVAYLKLLGGRDERRRQRRTRALVTAHEQLLAAGLPVPRVLEHDAAAGRVTLANVHGRTLREALRTGDPALPRADEVARLVRDLHGTALPSGGDPDGFADATRHVAVLRRELPDRSDDLERLAAAAAAVGGPMGTIHGDLHDGQLLLDDRGDLTGLLDVDGVGTGHVAHDVGRLLAHVEAGALAAPDRAELLTDYADDLLAAFDGHVSVRDVARAAAGAWVGLATGPLRVASPSWRSEVAARLDRGLTWLERLG